MIEISLYIKKKVLQLKDSIKINREKKQTISINRPETFKELDQIIKTKFNLSGKEFAIKALDSEEEEYNVKDDKTYKDEDVKNCLIFHVITEEENNAENIPSQQSNGFNIDKIFDIQNELTIEEDEFKKILDSQVDEEINKEKFEIKDDEDKKSNKSQNNLFNYFWDNFQKKIDSETEEKKKAFVDKIKEEFFPLDKILDDKVNNLNKNLENIMGQTNEAKKEVEKMKELIPIISLIGKEKKEDKKENIGPIFSISSDKKDFEIFKENAGNFNIEDIKIKNISNEKVSFKNKYWMKDKSSSSDIDFSMDKNTNDLDGELGANEEKKATIYLTIKNPKTDKYSLKFYIGDNIENNHNVTQEFLLIKINVKDNINIKVEEPRDKEVINNGDLTEERVQEIFDDLESRYYVSATIGEEEMKKTIRKFGGDPQKCEEYAANF